jgi:hypothetical protein
VEPDRLRRGEQRPRRRAPGGRAEPARNRLRPRFHRQRGRPDQRLRRAPPARPPGGRGAGRPDRRDDPPRPRRGRAPRHDAAPRGADPGPRAPARRHRRRGLTGPSVD